MMGYSVMDTISVITALYVQFIVDPPVTVHIPFILYIVLYVQPQAYQRVFFSPYTIFPR